MDDQVVCRAAPDLKPRSANYHCIPHTIQCSVMVSYEKSIETIIGWDKNGQHPVLPLLKIIYFITMLEGTLSGQVLCC